MSGLFLLILIANPDLEEALVDWLLEHEARYGFSSSHIYGHSSRLGELTLAEQVAGRKRQLCFQMCVEKEMLDFLLERLQRDFPGSGIHYWAVPVVAEGEV